MAKKTGTKKPEIQELPRFKDRVSFLYVEHAVINRVDGSVTVKKDDGDEARIPVAMIGVLLLGPGTNIAHRAVELLGEAGTSMVWVGEHGVRQYAHGRALTHNAKYLTAQAKLFSNTKTHLEVARKMYKMRFGNQEKKDVDKLYMEQLRSYEGNRMKKVYRNLAKEFNVEWNGRVFDPEDFEAGDPLNQAISVANFAMYGLVYSVIAALGLSPGLGFVHVDHDLSFVYDIADLYKADFALPVAFKVFSEYKEGDDIANITRRAMRDAFVDGKIIVKIVNDLQILLDIKVEETLVSEGTETSNILSIWGDKDNLAEAGVNYYLKGG